MSLCPYLNTNLLQDREKSKIPLGFGRFQSIVSTLINIDKYPTT
jgi:hypothetical protein